MKQRLLSVVMAVMLGITSVFSTGVPVFAAESSEDKSSEVTLLTLDSGVLSYTSSNTVKMQITNESRNGIYFLSSKTLGFYSLDDYSFTTEYTFTGCTSAYEEGDMLYVLYKTYCYVYDLDNNVLDRTIEFTNLSSEDTVSSMYAVGVDTSGRIYVATGGTADSKSIYQIWLYSSDGTLLSSMAVDQRVYSFDGFDDQGNFYMESYYNWVYWGYDHPGRAITMGTVTDDTISFTETSGSVTISGILTYSLSCLEYICQSSYYLHQKGADVIGGKYLVTASTTYGRVNVIDTESFSSVLYLSRTGVEVSQSSTYYDVSSIGVRTVYNEANDTVVIYENDKILNEYDIESGEIVGTYETAHYVFNLLTMGDDVVAIEKEDDVYYIEIINWAAPTEFSIDAESSSMQVGESQQLSVSSQAAYTLSYAWESSDSGVVSVTSGGKVTAWKEGTATITCTSPDGVSTASYTITVSGATVVSAEDTLYVLSGYVSDNVSDNNYSTYYSSTVKSYIFENDDGTLTRVEYTSDGVLVEIYSAEHELLSTQTLENELSRFGGFYAGEEYNYLVFGQSNTDEDDSVEVLRIVKYSKSWERISSCSVYGANTYVPFNAGSLRMTETNGLLYVYTCHTMYASSGSTTHHQANMTFVIDESTMTVTDSYYEVMNNSYGYVSHSFNQFIQTDGEYVYRVDHGDAYPRGIYLSKVAVGDSVTDVSYTTTFSILGTSGANATGVSVGGMELSDDNVIIAGNSVDQSDSDTYSASGQRNIFITVTDKEYLDSETIWITDYTSDDGVTPRTPQLVKISDDQFLLMWEEYYSASATTVTRMVTMNGEGELTSDITCTSMRLSDCQPIVTDDGYVTWYVTDGSSAVLYSINPYDLPDDVSAEEISKYDISDATVTLSASILSYTGSAVTPSVTVIYDGTTLTEGTDYTVSYSDNTEAGMASVIITGTGNYRESISKIFIITTQSTDYAGFCGDTLGWEFNSSTGTLTIFGTGDMYDYYDDWDDEYIYPWDDFKNEILEVAVEDGVTSLDERAFYGCENLTEVIIPDGCIPGEYTFSDCSKLADKNGFLIVGGVLYEYYGTASKVEIPDTVNRISSFAFSGNLNITSIEIPDTVTIIGSSFTKCMNLKSITIPDSVTSLGECAFQYCVNLETVVLSDNITELEYGIFYGCSSLVSVVLPENLQTMYFSVFIYCAGLTDVYYGGTEDDWNEITIDSTGNTYLLEATIHYESSAADMEAAGYSADRSGYSFVEITEAGSYEQAVESGKYVYFSVTPYESGYFTFFARYYVTHGYICDSSWTVLAVGEYRSSSITSSYMKVYLEAGETYYVAFLTDTANSSITFVANGNFGSREEYLASSDISNASVTLSSTSYTYSGSAKKPSVTVKINGTTLTKGTDYTVSYSNNTNAGTAKVTITGTGSYTGSVSVTFTINQKTISSESSAAKVTLSKTSYTYTGTAKKPTPTVKITLNGSTKTLKKGTDYTVTYKNNTSAGTATVVITGTGNYKGTLKKTFTINQKTISSESSAAKVTLSKTSYTYTGSAKKPTPTVKITLNGSTKTLKKGTDYTVTYSGNVKAGTATVTIKGTGNYKGTLKKTFTIKKASQTLKVTYSSSKTVKYSKVKSAKQTVKAITKVSGAKGTVTYTKSSGSKYLSVSKTTGKITVKKGTPKGTYKIKVKIKSAATTNYSSASKTVTITIKVK